MSRLAYLAGPAVRRTGVRYNGTPRTWRNSQGSTCALRTALVLFKFVLQSGFIRILCAPLSRIGRAFGIEGGWRPWGRDQRPQLPPPTPPSLLLRSSLSKSINAMILDDFGVLQPDEPKTDERCEAMGVRL